jgi:hypothetical protein
VWFIGIVGSYAGSEVVGAALLQHPVLYFVVVQCSVNVVSYVDIFCSLVKEKALIRT